MIQDSPLQLVSSPPTILRRVWHHLRAAVYCERLQFHFCTQGETTRFKAELRAHPEVTISAPTIEIWQNWCELLNKDEGFGEWTAERLEREVIARLIAPDSAVLAWIGNRLIGCAAVCRSNETARIDPELMFLIVDSDVRRTGVARLILAGLLSIAEARGYTRARAETDPHRYSALRLYFQFNIRPEFSSLWSFVQWRRVRARLRKLSRSHQQEQQASNRFS